MSACKVWWTDPVFETLLWFSFLKINSLWRILKKWKGTDEITKLVILDDFLESFQSDLSFCLQCEMHFWVSPRSAVTDIFCCLWLCDKDYLLHPGCLWYVIARQISDRSRYRVLACTWFTMSNRIESANVVTKIPIWSQKRPNFACKSQNSDSTFRCNTVLQRRIGTKQTDVTYVCVSLIKPVSGW